MRAADHLDGIMTFSSGSEIPIGVEGAQRSAPPQAHHGHGPA
jgi:hypothetical protein